MEMIPYGAIVKGGGSNRPTSGNWRNPDIAKDDWSWIRCDDWGHYPGPEKCQMCLMKHPRYLHRVQHPIHGRWTVGRICAAWMTGDPRVEEAERELRLAARREKDREPRALQKQIAQAWKKGGARWRVSCQGCKATVFPNNGGYEIHWGSRRAEPFDNETYSSVEAAKKAATRAMARWILKGRKKPLPEVEDWQ